MSVTCLPVIRSLSSLSLSYVACIPNSTSGFIFDVKYSMVLLFLIIIVGIKITAKNINPCCRLAH